MRYYLDPTTLFIRGSFRAAGTSVTGVRSVSSIMMHSAPEGMSHADPVRELEFVAAGAGIGRDFLGLTTGVPVGNLCVLRYDFITVFIATAAPRGGPYVSTGIIIVSAEGVSDTALHEIIAVVGEARTDAFLSGGFSVIAMPEAPVIAAGEGEIRHTGAGRDSEVGHRVHEAVLHGIPLAIERSGQPIPRKRPSFFIFSRIKGDHWVEWSPEDCQYFPGQRCDFCYCPFYPCGDESLGQWVESSLKGKVWNCARCTLLHEAGVADYLQKFPGASPAELVQVRNKLTEKQKK